MDPVIRSSTANMYIFMLGPMPAAHFGIWASSKWSSESRKSARENAWRHWKTMDRRELNAPITRFSPWFSADGSQLLCCEANNIAVYTGITRVNSLTGHTDVVTALVDHPSHSGGLISSSLDGTLREWSANDYTPGRLISFESPIVKVVTASKSPFAVVATLSEAVATIYRIDLSTTNPAEKLFAVKIDTIQQSPECFPLTMSPSGDMIVSASRREITVWAAGKLHRHKIPRAKEFGLVVGLDYHPYEKYVAAAMSRGRIVFWHALTGKPVTSSVHWHSSGVRAICFSDDGAYLYSAGEEAVLVFWQLESGAKQFLPRLGAPINALTQRGNRICVAGADNVAKVIDIIRLAVSSSISGVRTPDNHPLATSKSFQLNVSKLDDSLFVCIGGDGILQQVRSGRVIRSWDVKGSLSNVNIDMICPLGNHGLVVVEHRRRVKWINSVGGLDAVVNQTDVTSVAASNEGSITWILTRDGILRKWIRKGKSVEVEAVGEWKGYRGTALDVSKDASAVAVGMEKGIVVFWNALSMEVEDLLVSGVRLIHGVKFIGSKWVIVWGKGKVEIWDVVTLRLVEEWARDVISVDVEADQFAMLFSSSPSHKRTIELGSISESGVTINSVVEGGKTEIVQIVDKTLIAATGNGVFHSFGGVSAVNEVPVAPVKRLREQVLEDLVRNTKRQQVVQPVAEAFDVKKAISGLFSGPSYLTRNLGDICQSFGSQMGLAQPLQEEWVAPAKVEIAVPQPTERVIEWDLSALESLHSTFD